MEKENKFKVGDHVILHEKSWWGSYQGTDAIVTRIQDDLVTVKTHDERLFSAHPMFMMHPEDYYSLEEKKEDLPDIPKCKCEIIKLMRYGCICGGI